MPDTKMTYDMIFDMLKDVNTKTNLYIVDEENRKEIDKKLKQISVLVNVVHYVEWKQFNEGGQ